MTRALRLAGKDLRRHALSIVLLMAQFAVCLYFLFLLSFYLSFAADSSSGSERMAAHDPVGIETRGGRAASLSGAAAKSYLTDALTPGGKAYAVIPSALEAGNEIWPLYVGLGRFAEVFELLPAGQTASSQPMLLIGSGITALDTGMDVNLGQGSSAALRIAGRLKPGANFYEGLSKVPLDQAFLLLCSYEQFTGLLPWDAASIPLNRIILLAPSHEEIDALISMASTGMGVEMRPYGLGPALRDSAQSVRHWVSYYLSFFLCLLMMISLGMVISLYRLIDSNMREYAIHRLSGATMGDLGLRTLVYVACLILPPFLLFPLYLSQTIYLGMLSTGWIAGIALAAFILFYSLPMLRLRRQDAAAFFRRDD